MHISVPPSESASYVDNDVQNVKQSMWLKHRNLPAPAHAPAAAPSTHVSKWEFPHFQALQSFAVVISSREV